MRVVALTCVGAVVPCMLLLGCAAARPVPPDVLSIEPGRYAAVFDAAAGAARAAGLDPVFRDSRDGIIETAALPAGSILEPWTNDNATMGQAWENTIAWQRRRARFEFTPRADSGEQPADAAPGGPDLLALREKPPDLTASAEPIELRVRVFLERAEAPGIRRDPWSRALTTRSAVRHGSEPWQPDLFWVPITRDLSFERRLMSAVQGAIEE